MQVGGQLRLYGMPGGGQTPSWVRLSATAYEGTNKLRVVGDVSKSWFVGAAIAVASTDFHYDHAEEFRIRGCECPLWLPRLESASPCAALGHSSHCRHHPVLPDMCSPCTSPASLYQAALSWLGAA